MTKRRRRWRSTVEYYWYRGFWIRRTASPRDSERWLLYRPSDNRDFDHHATIGSAIRQADLVLAYHQAFVDRGRLALGRLLDLVKAGSGK